MQDPHDNRELSSRALRASREPSRRPSRLSSNDERLREPSVHPPSDSGRDRYWKTILGGSPQPYRRAEPGSSQYPVPTPLPSPDGSVNYGGLPRPFGQKPCPPPPRRRSQPDLEYHPNPRSGRTPPPKPFACEQCMRRFERKGHLKSHVDAVHELQQPYMCNFRGCQRTFSHRSSLHRHLKGVHQKFRNPEKSGERSYGHGHSSTGSGYEYTSGHP